MADAEADGLELQVVLVRPEPRYRAVGCGRAEDDARRDLRLIDGVLDAFEPDASPAGEAVDMVGAVADRQHVGKRGAATFVDLDSVAGGGARRRQYADRRDDADPDDDE